MKKILFAVLAVSLMLVVAGCGSSSHGPSSIVTQIDSTAANDGEIVDTAGTRVVNQGPLSFIRAGVDPTIASTEYAAFLDFNLTGNVPGDAIIDSATLEIFVNRLTLQQSATVLPIQIELVALPTLSLAPSYFDLPVVRATKFTNIFPSDVNTFVQFNVTDLMREAQRAPQLTHFQVRIIEDLTSTVNGVVEIEDAIASKSPLLEVVYH